jgi:hypothetical protein
LKCAGELDGRSEAVARHVHCLRPAINFSP